MSEIFPSFSLIIDYTRSSNASSVLEGGSLVQKPIYLKSEIKKHLFFHLIYFFQNFLGTFSNCIDISQIMHFYCCCFPIMTIPYEHKKLEQSLL
jgi:hypothetical protein